MIDIRKCPHCEVDIDCSKGGYRTLNGHKSNCVLNPKFESRAIKKRDSFIRNNDDLLRKIVSVNCIVCNKPFEIKASKKSLKQGNYNKHCSRACANVTTNNKGLIGKVKSLKLAYKNGLMTGLGTNKNYEWVMTEKRRKWYKSSHKKRIKINCLTCNKEIEIISSRLGKTKFCNGSCRNNFNNKIIRGTRSRAELMLENSLKNEFPHLTILSNNRTILNGLEMDIYIPELKLAIEWNGIHHYVDVRNDGNLLKRQEADKRKKKLIREMGLRLIVIKDLISSKSEIKKHIVRIVNKIRTFSSDGRTADL